MKRHFSHVRFISAGAGSGKTYRLTEELEHALLQDGVRPDRVIGTTFTVKAAGELRERVRERLIHGGRPQLAEQMAQALIGTVHSVCERLLKRFAFELGLSPEMNVVSLEDGTRFFNQALDEVLANEIQRVRTMNALADRLGMSEWCADVRRLANRARSNDIAAEQLPPMGRQSADALLSFFPKPQDGPWDDQLLAAVRDALHVIDPGIDTTQKTAAYIAGLRTAIYQLRRPPVPWSVWIRLSKAGCARKSEPHAAPVRKAASVYEIHPAFQADIRDYIEHVYDIAAKTLQRFQALKAERGLIDFEDMEQLTLRALEDPLVCGQLAEELELLLVDEFQDTNPMQLAIFMGLAELADHVIFVGDVKQAIYAFRGCDPDLVFETLSALTRHGGAGDILEHSWRSRPPLVHYLNAVFTQAFEGEIPPAQVQLRPARPETTDGPAVLRWRLAGKASERAKALSRAIGTFVNSDYRVVDPDTRTVRSVQWGDIAVLAATNEHVEDVAAALRAARIPMKMTLSGLLAVPEVCLAKACLRRLNDRTDTLATAEIVAMTDGGQPGVWLAERLRWAREQEDGYAWAETTHPVIAKLRGLRAETATQSPVEVVARILNYVGIREVVTAWGPDAVKAAQRQRNLDAFLNLAVEYERHCDAQHLAATLTGFLFWLENPHSPELDLQPVVTTGNAVHVLTYHRAKGLEWPVVVNTDFHYCWRSRLWDVRVESAGDAFDIRKPLADRVIRFWPKIFGKQSKGIPVLDNMLGSDEAKHCARKGEAENRRLAYVGMTRARDAIVLAEPCTGPRSGAWIHAFNGDCLMPQGGTLELPENREIATVVRTFDEGTGSIEPPAFAPRRFPVRTPLTTPAREGVSPSQAAAIEGTRIARIVELGERVPLRGDDMTAIGSGLHAVIAAHLVNPDRDEAPARAQAILGAYGAASYLDARDAARAARQFREWLGSSLQPTHLFAEYPVAHRLDDGRVVRGWLDVLVETADGCIVIDHKSSPRPRSEWAGEIVEYSGQLASYRRALEASGKCVLGVWVHLPVAGAVVLTTV